MANNLEANFMSDEHPTERCNAIERPSFRPNDLCDEIVALVLIAAEELELENEKHKSFEGRVRVLLEEQLELHFRNGDCLTANQMNILVNAHCAVKRKMKMLETRIEVLEKDMHSHPKNSNTVKINPADTSAKRDN